MVQIDEEIGIRVRQGRRRHFKYQGHADPENYVNAWFNYPIEGVRPLRFVAEETFCVESVDERSNGYDLTLRKEGATSGCSWNMRHQKDAQELIEATSSTDAQDLVGKGLKVYIKDNIVIGIGV